ncbi:MAG: ABC transporter ATP-binding protein [Clostridiaceae bacterium]
MEPKRKNDGNEMISLTAIKVEPINGPNKIINYWKKEKGVVAAIIFFGLTFNIAVVLGPIYQGKLLDALLSKKSYPEVLKIAVLFIALVSGIQVMRFFKRFYIRRFANSTLSTMRLMIYNNILDKKLDTLENEDVGNLTTTAISDVDACVEGMRKFTTEIFDTGVLMASYFVSMILYDLKITLMVSVFIPIAMFLAEKLKLVIYKRTSEYRVKKSEMASLTDETVENTMLYRANGMEDYYRNRYEEELIDLEKKSIRASILENAMQPVYNIIAMMGVVLVIYFGGMKVIEGGWTVGAFSTYFTMLAALALKASRAAKLFNSVQKSKVSWTRIKPYMKEYVVFEKEDQDETRGEEPLLQVENLSFTYPSADESRAPVIKNVTFTAERGMLIGVTGPIASGKSTLGLALLGIYPYEGSIKIAGKELNEIPDPIKSVLISYQGHRPSLFSDTLAENIMLGREGDISKAIKSAALEVDLKSMPEERNTKVGNMGIRLSGGQQARVALARSLYGENNIIILDDPFSAVDMKTEEEIVKNLKALYKNSLIILISHRISIFKETDLVILFDQKKNTLHGTHEELLEKSKIYHSIYSIQRTIGVDINER